MSLPLRDDISSLVKQRLEQYNASTDLQMVNAAKEIIQEIALCGLSRQGFFNHAAFHGGSAFRILYGLDRFSEDLDFCLHKPNPQFDLKDLLHPLSLELEAWGTPVEIVDRSNASSAVKKAFLKSNSLGAQLSLRRPLQPGQKLVIKIELDINPPEGATIESKLCDFPFDFYVTSHDLSSMFAGKMHAILCRQYLKGRDWYDLAVYLTRATPINLHLLHSALKQIGPYAETAQLNNPLNPLPNPLNNTWVLGELRNKINAVDFNKLKNDVRPFIKDESKISLWSTHFFLDKVEKYERTVSNSLTVAPSITPSIT